MPSTITTPDLIKRYLLGSESDVQAPMIRLYNVAVASQTAATVQVTSVSIVLTIAGGANAGTSTLLFSTYTPPDGIAGNAMTNIVAAINALNKGWAAVVDGEPAEAAASLSLLQTTSAQGQTQELTLYGTANYLLTVIANGVNDQIEKICNRVFASTAYTERYNGNGKPRLYLKQCPIVSVSRVSVGSFSSLLIENTGAGNTAASVRVTSTGLALSKTNSSGVSATDSTVLFATYPTLTQVVNAVIALGNGWTAQLASSSYGTYPSAVLDPCGGRYCLDSFAYLTSPNPGESDYQENDLAGYIDLLTGAPNVNDDTIWGGSQYWGSRRVGNYGRVFPRGVNNVYVEYTAGYSTIPAGLVSLATELGAQAYQHLRYSPGLTGGKVTDIEWQRPGAGLMIDTAENRTRLRPYMRQSV